MKGTILYNINGETVNLETLYPKDVNDQYEGIPGTEFRKKVKRANDYADSFDSINAQNSEIKNISENPVTINIEEHNKGKPVIIGPFKLNVDIYKTQVELLDKNNNSIDAPTILMNNSEGYLGGVENVSKENEFYVSINKDVYEDRGISNLKIKNSTSTMYCVKIDFYATISGDGQTMMYYTPLANKTCNDLYIPLNLFGDLEITKVHGVTGEKLKWIYFMVMDINGNIINVTPENDNGEYFKYHSGDITGNVTNVIGIGDNEVLKIKNLPIGHYRIYELKDVNNNIYVDEYDEFRSINDDVDGDGDVDETDQELGKAIKIRFEDIIYNEQVADEYVKNRFKKYDDRTMDILKEEYVEVIANPESGKNQITIKNNTETGSLSIKKVDADEESKLLPNVTFKIKNSEGKYLKPCFKSGTSGRYIYSGVYENNTDAEVFSTFESGIIAIDGLPLGQYTVEEIENPDPEYEDDDYYIREVSIIDIGEEIEIIVKNKKEYVPNSSGENGNVWLDGGDGKTTKRNGEWDNKDLNVEGVKVELTYTIQKFKREQSKTRKKIFRKVRVDCGLYVYSYSVFAGYGNYTNWSDWSDWDVDSSEKVKKTVYTDKYGNYDFDFTYFEKPSDGVDTRETGWQYRRKNMEEKVNTQEKERVVDIKFTFEYDGFKYQAVTSNEDSKAIEVDTDRQKLNNYYKGPITNNKVNDKKIDYIGPKHNISVLEYYNEENDNNDNTGNWYTKEDECLNVFGNRKPNEFYVTAVDNQELEWKDGVKPIKFGLYLREQPDIALVTDMEKVEVSINGYNHIYKYNERFIEQDKSTETNEIYNQGDGQPKIQFVEKNKTYSRDVYASDIEYAKSPKGNMEMYVTYKIAVINQSTYLKLKINSIKNAWSDKYEFQEAWDDSGTKSVRNESIIIGDNELINPMINPMTARYIYVKYKVDNSYLIGTDKTESLRVFAEINSYNVYDINGTEYAGIDKDSNPGNATAFKEDTYEDDTDEAPGFIINHTIEKRSVTGNIFEDKVIGITGKGNTINGNGVFDDDESAIVAGVKVELIDIKNKNRVVHGILDSKGSYKIEGFIPGDYMIAYTWGNEKYNVHNYKSTIYAYENNEKIEGLERKDKNYGADKISSEDDYKQWWINEDKRYSDAVDIYDEDDMEYFKKLINIESGTRLSIDEGIKELKHNTQTTMNKSSDVGAKKLTAMTPVMGIGVEKVEVDNSNTGVSESDIDEYVVGNLDFGIVKRAMQKIELDKRVSQIKVTLASGQIFADAKLDVDNKLVANYLTHIKNGVDVNNPVYGYVKLIMDPNLTQGAVLETEYEYRLTNISELDYVDEDYYKYGILPGEDKKVKFETIDLIDYLDKDAKFDVEKGDNVNWISKTQAELKDSDIVSGDVTSGSGTDIQNREIYVRNETDSSLIDDLVPEAPSGSKLSEDEISSSSVKFKTSQILHSAEDIELENEAEVIRLVKSGGAEIDTTLGNYIPGTAYNEGSSDASKINLLESDDDVAEKVIITPNTGENLNYIIPIVITIAAFGIIVIGIIIIKKKVLKAKSYVDK